MLAVENITKRFPGVIALNNVSMELYPGKVNAILGENGAGKSTLMKILSGVYPDYEGRILYKDEPVYFTSVREAQACGIAIIHQELNLIPYLNIRENIFLGREILNKWGLLDKEAMRNRTKALLKRLKLDLDPDTPVSQLKIGQQQVVEIAKALLIDADVIIMDEPTSAISDHEVDVLFGIIENLRKENKIIVYISHKLDELFRIADRFVVLRDGCSIESGDMKGMDQDSLIQKMVGRHISIIRKQKEDQSVKDELLRIENLSLRHSDKAENVLKDISFSLGRGEILGLFGLMGAGRTELMEALFGLHPKRTVGSIYVDGKHMHFSSPADAIKAGLALVPEDRKKDGLVLGMDVRTNICLTTLDDLETGGLLNHDKECDLAEKYIGELRIKTPSDKQAVNNLSGGNQQKIVLAKWLAKKPKVLMLDEPTRGIDINAKNEIYNIILQLADAGIGIIVVSSELPEILAISDRILVLSEGRLTAEIPVSSASENVILKAAIPKTI
ncbi:sugar ABC transporter ATP-binding protein [Chitinophagaceae bacterium LB-8]|uniref:Sugar ABC transporter ATP-binding protein n=1 Tax=Paraflavisolibacter caeni TaxID=2982496 RepID=A0A9X3BI23_9BACT|nr:sugar ABC transporter ATP-binding protein [Paraflavisolibacter caeni]MCU7550597.1 sugar ABC transporter ATP-binding protein [Paraflavisolibacter caeni]